MKAVIRSTAFVHSIVIAVSLFAIGVVAAQSQKSIELNEIAFTFAMGLIKEGQALPDRKGGWTKHRPSADEENEFIRLHGFAQYAKWHLGIDRRFPENTKRRYKFPLRRFQKCSSVRAAGSGSQSPTIWLRRNRNRGGRVGPSNKATQLICVILWR